MFKFISSRILFNLGPMDTRFFITLMCLFWLFSTCKSPIMQLILHKHCFQFLLGRLAATVIPRRNEKQRLCKILGSNKVHYGRCAISECGSRVVYPMINRLVYPALSRFETRQWNRRSAKNKSPRPLVALPRVPTRTSRSSVWILYPESSGSSSVISGDYPLTKEPGDSG